MNKEAEHQATKRREYTVAKALKPTLFASDPPSFVGADASLDGSVSVKESQTAAEMASEAIDQHTDQTASSDEQASRKRRLLKGPKEFRDLRRDGLTKKR